MRSSAKRPAALTASETLSTSWLATKGWAWLPFRRPTEFAADASGRGVGDLEIRIGDAIALP